MKKYFLPILALAMLTFSSCGDEPVRTGGSDAPNNTENNQNGNNNQNNQNGENNENGDDNSGNGTGDISEEALKPSQQQAKLKSVGEKALSYVSALDFTYYRQMAEYVDDHYIDNRGYDTDVVEDFFEDLVESSKIGGVRTEREQYRSDWGDYSSISNYVYNYQDYRNLIRLSNIRGHFTAGRNGWEKQSGNDLQFTFTDQNGKQCVAKLTTSGSSKTVHVYNDEDWYNYNWKSEQSGNTYIYTTTEDIDNNKYYIEIPERINVSLTVDGRQRLTAEVKLNLSGIANEMVDLSKVSCDAEADVKIDSYHFKTTNIKYQPSSIVSTDFKFIKDSKTIIDLQVLAKDFDMMGVGGDIVEEDTWDDIEDYFSISGGNAVVRLNILGELQLNATLRDFKKVQDAFEEMDDNQHNGSVFKTAVENFNSLFEAGVYYDGTATKQAIIKLMAFEERDWNESYWDVQPVICFADGSSYSLMEENSFFNESAFKSLIDAFDKLADDFEELLDD